MCYDSTEAHLSRIRWLHTNISKIEAISIQDGICSDYQFYTVSGRESKSQPLSCHVLVQTCNIAAIRYHREVPIEGPGSWLLPD